MKNHTHPIILFIFRWAAGDEYCRNGAGFRGETGAVGEVGEGGIGNEGGVFEQSNGVGHEKTNGWNANGWDANRR